MEIPTVNGQFLLTRLLQNKLVGLIVYNRKLKICEWNPLMEKLTGLKRNDCLGEDLFDIIRTPRAGQDEKKFRAALKGEQFTLKNKPLLIRNGRSSEKKFDLLLIPLDEPDRSIHCSAVIVVENEEEKVKATVERHKTAYRSLSSFLTYAPMPVFIIDKNYRVQLANEAFNQFFDAENTIGQRLDDLVNPDFNGSEWLEKPKKAIQEVIENERLDIAHEQYTIGGKEQHFYIIRFPVRNAQGKVDAIGGYALEITEEIEQEQKIQQLLSETIALNEALEGQNEKLLKSQERLEAANKRLKQKSRKLKEAMKELSDRNFELDQIMYKTSHDLRSPLTSILGLLSLIKDENDPDKLPEYLAYMEDRIGKLDTFVKSMLTYAKTSRLDLKPVEISWEELIKDSLSNLEYMTHFNQLNISSVCTCKKFPFRSDILRLKIIFNNLLGNAIKYADLSKPDPFIRIEVETLADKAVISFQDNGIGIEEKYLSEIGKMFFRATEKSEGSGLGMYIVKQAIERLGGSIQIASEPGKGTTIRIMLPTL